MRAGARWMAGAFLAIFLLNVASMPVLVLAGVYGRGAKPNAGALIGKEDSTVRHKRRTCTAGLPSCRLVWPNHVDRLPRSWPGLGVWVIAITALDLFPRQSRGHSPHNLGFPDCLETGIMGATAARLAWCPIYRG